MMRILPRSQGKVLGVLCSEKITLNDYKKTLIPALNRIIAEHGKVRILFDFSDDFSGYELKAMMEDARYSFKHFKKFEKFAAINSPLWIRPMVSILDSFTKCRSRAFHKSARDEAWGWIEG